MNESVFEMLEKVEILVQNQHSNKQFSELKKDALAIMEKYEAEGAKTTELLPGALETLQALKKMKLKLGLFTINGQRTTNQILSTFRLKPFFKTVVTRDSVPKVKPNPVHLQTVLKKLKVKPEETMVVGDSKLDMMTARELKVYAVGTSTGIASPDELTNAGADCLITSPTDLIPLIEKLNERKEQ